MPRMKTFNPLKLKTGDRVYFIAFNDNYRKVLAETSYFRISPVLASATVIAKTERLAPAGEVQLVRQFNFVLKADEGQLPENVAQFTASEKSLLFMSVDEAIKYVATRFQEVVDVKRGHEERHEDYAEYKILPKEIV